MAEAAELMVLPGDGATALAEWHVAAGRACAAAADAHALETQ